MLSVQSSVHNNHRTQLSQLSTHTSPPTIPLTIIQSQVLPTRLFLYVSLSVCLRSVTHQSVLNCSKAGYVDHFMHPPHVDALYDHTGSVRTFDGFWDCFNFINTVCVEEAGTATRHPPRQPQQLLLRLLRLLHYCYDDQDNCSNSYYHTTTSTLLCI
jgi:hypothetical protein